MKQDVIYALRGLRKSPGFTVVAVATLALGIGANTAIFSVFKSALLRHLPYRSPERLVFVWSSSASLPRETLTPGRLLDFREQLTSLTAVAGISQIPLNLTGSGEPERLNASSVSSSFFDILGASPMLGDPFHTGTADDREVVLSYGLWARRFGSDPAMVGRQITLNGTVRTVVAVMPADFDWPAVTATPSHVNGPQLWIPGAVRDLPRTPADRADQDLSANRTAGYIRAVARLKDGITIDQAQREADLVAARIGQLHPETDGVRGASVVPLRAQFFGQLQRTMLVLVGAVILVLAIACANVAGLLLGRASARRKEMAIRRALGASGRRVVRQLVVESMMLALAGGVCGLLLARWAQTALLKLNPTDFLPLDHGQIDPAILAFTVTVSIVTGVLFGLAPALHAARDSMSAELSDGGGRSSAAPRSARSRELLVTLQLAIALILVVGGTLLVRSFSALQHVDTGIDTHNLLTFNVFLGGSHAQSQVTQAAFYEDVLARIRSLPDVSAAGAAVTLPIGGDDFSASYTIDGHEVARGLEPSAGYQVVTSGYFNAMRIPVLAGRDFNSGDVRDGAPVVLVNKTLAEREWPGADPVGRRMRMGPDDPWMTVIGVVGDVRQGGPAVSPRPALYQPVSQRSFSFMAFVVRTHHDPARVVPFIRSAIAAADPLQPISDLVSMDAHLARALSRPRFMSTLIAAFGMLALSLSVVGVYGVMAYAVTQRTREIAIRMALGAHPRTIVAMVLSRTMRLVAIGLVAGIAGAAVFVRMLSGLLFGLQASDTTTFVASGVLLAGAALAAGAIPAYRATRIDAVDALKL